MTVKALIERLSRLDPEAEVGVRAYCCNHTHEIVPESVRERRDGEDEEPPVVIDVSRT